jgi:hypothetical protein
MLGVPPIVGIKAAYSIKMVEIIEEEPAGSRNIVVADTRRLHVVACSYQMTAC